MAFLVGLWTEKENKYGTHFGTPPVYSVPELTATRQFCAARRTPLSHTFHHPLQFTAMSLARCLYKDEAQPPLPRYTN